MLFLDVTQPMSRRLGASDVNDSAQFGELWSEA